MNPTNYTKFDFDQLCNDMEEACRWLDIKQGQRARKYLRLLEESIQDRVLTPEHINSFFECYPLVDIYHSWHSCVDDFPGLQSKLRWIFEKGPVLTREENPDKSTNAPRNHAFSVQLAGRFRSAGLDVIHVLGYRKLGEQLTPHLDFSYEWEDSVFNVECKRPFSPAGLFEQGKKARSQIKKTGKVGLIAIDCSRVRINDLQDTIPEVKLLDNLFVWLQNNIAERLTKNSPLSSKVIGLVLYCTVPVVISNPGTTVYKRVCYTPFAFTTYPGSTLAKRMLKCICAKLKQHSPTHMIQSE